MKSSDAIRRIVTEPVLQQRIAKLMVLECFRNSGLEDLHAGISPSSAAGDYSDVVVNSPYGSIPWPQVSRLNDEEMKELMIDVVDGTYRLVHRLFDDREGRLLFLRLAERDPAPHWQTPSLRGSR
jgi:hypothetical protein